MSLIAQVSFITRYRYLAALCRVAVYIISSPVRDKRGYSVNANGAKEQAVQIGSKSG